MKVHATFANGYPQRVFYCHSCLPLCADGREPPSPSVRGDTSRGGIDGADVGSRIRAIFGPTPVRTAGAVAPIALSRTADNSHTDRSWEIHSNSGALPERRCRACLCACRQREPGDPLKGMMCGYDAVERAFRRASRSLLGLLQSRYQGIERGLRLVGGVEGQCTAESRECTRNPAMKVGETPRRKSSAPREEEASIENIMIYGALCRELGRTSSIGDPHVHLAHPDVEPSGCKSPEVRPDAAGRRGTQ